MFEHTTRRQQELETWKQKLASATPESEWLRDYAPPFRDRRKFSVEESKVYLQYINLHNEYQKLHPPPDITEEELDDAWSNDAFRSRNSMPPDLRPYLQPLWTREKRAHEIGDKAKALGYTVEYKPNSSYPLGFHGAELPYNIALVWEGKRQTIWWLDNHWIGHWVTRDRNGDSQKWHVDNIRLGVLKVRSKGGYDPLPIGLDSVARPITAVGFGILIAVVGAIVFFVAIFIQYGTYSPPLPDWVAVVILVFAILAGIVGGWETYSKWRGFKNLWH